MGEDMNQLSSMLVESMPMRDRHFILDLRTEVLDHISSRAPDGWLSVDHTTFDSLNTGRSSSIHWKRRLGKMLRSGGARPCP